jgi:transaldolase / glucose-6-phosphate isomerase
MSRPAWIDAPHATRAEWPTLAAFATAVRGDGLTRVLLCGMGGSSLAPTVLAHAFGAADFTVLDSTDPAAVLEAEQRAPPDRTLFLIASKSGTTVETLAAYRYFAARAAPGQFVAITDPGTPLEAQARQAGFRAVFGHPPDIGGRYAALTVVGMLPAALMGADGAELLSRARRVDVDAASALGRVLADRALAGRDKLALHVPPPVAVLGSWIEQLVAESSGKDGKGVIPIRSAGTGTDVQEVSEFTTDPLDLGAEFLRWEYATWALCERLGVNAFDQPDVQAAKALARAELERPRAAAPDGPATLAPAELLRAARPGDYVAVLAYLAPQPASAAALERVRAAWAAATGCATTAEFGPRYLHSTGQLHKGGPNTGLFLVVTADHAQDVEIPGLNRTFGELERAQAIGDVRALLAKGRRVAHVHLTGPDGLEDLARV